MAAHILRVLSEVAEGKVPAEQVRAALDYAPACDSLAFDHWDAMSKAVNDAPESIPELAARLLPEYASRYFRLQCPATCEAWREAEHRLRPRLALEAAVRAAIKRDPDAIIVEVPADVLAGS